MNQAETWKSSARQQTGQSIENLLTKLETLRRSRIDDADKTAERMANALVPVAEALHHLTSETRAAISPREHETRTLTDKTLTAAAQVQREAEEARQAVRSFARIRSPFTRKMLAWCVLTAMLSTLPLTGWLGWQWWTNRTEATRWRRIALDMDSYIVEIHPDMSQARRDRIDRLYLNHNLLPPSRQEGTEPNKPSNGN